MCMEFDAVSGTGGCLGLLGEGEPSLTADSDCAGDALCSDVILFTPSTRVAGSGGGNGDIDKADIDAECAWYTRIDLNRGRDRTCWSSRKCLEKLSRVLSDSRYFHYEFQ